MTVFRRRPDAAQFVPEVTTNTRARVTVTFLRQDRPSEGPVPTLPQDASLVRLGNPSVAFYRYLYATVGAPYIWWLRRTLPDAELAGIIQAAGVSIHVLYRENEPHGFFELDARGLDTVNLSYFGLMPQSVGKGLGTPFLRAALSAAWAHGPRSVTVNTCTADNARALPTYLACGFHIVRTSDEIWDVPDRLGLTVPDRLR